LKSLEQVTVEIARALKSIESFLPRAGSLERLLLPPEVAEILRIEVETLEGWRSKGIGPKYLKLGKREIRYRPSEVLRWLDERVCSATWDHQPS
jgi:predicted DNA-binding transcriptional regulator AlpA